jgi:putative acetyltransferase
MGAFEVRALRGADAAAMAALGARPEVVRFGEHPPEPGEAWAIERIGDGGPDLGGMLGAFRGGRLIAAGLLRRRARPRAHHAARLWLYGGEESGTLREALGEIVDRLLDAADRWSNVVRCDARCAFDDPRVSELLLPRGFVEEAVLRGGLLRDGVAVDERWLGRLRPGWIAPPPPGEPRPPTVPPRGEQAPSMHIRRMTPDDADAMHALMTSPSVVWGTLQSPLQSPDHWRRLLSRQATSADCLLCAEVDGVLAGNCGVHGAASARREHAASLGMGVDPRFQGMGVGGALLDAVLALADGELGLSRVDLEVYEDNERGLRLYEGRGFVREGIRRAAAFRDGRFVDNVLMARVTRGGQRA